MNKKGYTLKELIIVLAAVTIVALVSIIKISFAFSDLDNSSEIEKTEKIILKKAIDIYATNNIDKVREEKEVYVSGKELIEQKILADSEEYSNLKVKISYVEAKDSYKYDILNK